MVRLFRGFEGLKVGIFGIWVLCVGYIGTELLSSGRLNEEGTKDLGGFLLKWSSIRCYIL